MRKNVVLCAFLLLLGAWQSGALAGTTDSLADVLFNVNGTVTESSLSIPGLDTSGFNATTGEGTLTFTYNPGAAGSYFFDAWIDNDLNTPFFNEYGAVNGSASAGQSWEIGDPSAFYAAGLPAGSLGPGVDIVDDTALNALSNTNNLPGNTSNFNPPCTPSEGSSCNGDASMAMGFAFTLTSSQYEVITLNLSETAPNGGFYLQQIHPVDGNNDTQLNLYLTGSASTQQSGGGGTPEPGTWILVSSAVGALAFFRSRKRGAKALRFGLRAGGPLVMLLAVVLLAQTGQAQITVKTVPWVPTSPSVPHTTYNVCSDGTIPSYTTNPPTCSGGATLTEATIRLGATVTLPNTTDTYTGVWNFGDGSPNYSFSVSNASLINYDVSTTHQYPATACGNALGCGGNPQATWTATLTVTDTNTSKQGSATFPVIQQQDTLSARVNVAIDAGLWYVHQTMWRNTITVSGNQVNVGGWDSIGGSCVIPSGQSYTQDCTSYGGIDANYVQAYEVNGHLETGPASDPYTDDVSRGLAQMMTFLVPTAVASKQVTYNPAVMVDRCSDGTTPNFATTPPTCSTGTLIQYNPGATSCTTAPTTPCNFTFDGNSNGQLLLEGNDSGDPGYQVGMFVDAIVASGNPAGKAKAGPVAASGLPGVYGVTYQNIVQDLVDGINYCQYGGDPYDGASNGYDAGGGWFYYCASQGYGYYDDNSISQWNAVGLIGANRAFGISIPSIVTDTNQVWVTYSQDVSGAAAFSGIADGGSLTGAFGYDEWGYEPWGPFAVTPSGLVQMAMDGIGRTSAANPDQRWNMAETFYHDNFCFNSATNYGPSGSGYYYDPLYYTYGMFSFSKSMLLYSPGGVLSPIINIEDQPSGTNPIDWYGALSPANGGTAPCDGFAQTLVSRQNSDGHWGGYPYYYDENYTQGYFETAWALIILKQSVFVACINNLYGQGKPSTALAKARVDLTWAAQPNAVSYNVLRSSTNGGPYTLLGNTTTTAYSDTKGLTNGSTYYYVVQPVNSGKSEICQSNQTKVTVPKGH